MGELMGRRVNCAPTQYGRLLQAREGRRRMMEGGGGGGAYFTVVVNVSIAFCKVFAHLKDDGARRISLKARHHSRNVTGDARTFHLSLLRQRRKNAALAERCVKKHPRWLLSVEGFSSILQRGVSGISSGSGVSHVDSL